jgi:hypothetical protein
MAVWREEPPRKPEELNLAEVEVVAVVDVVVVDAVVDVDVVVFAVEWKLLMHTETSSRTVGSGWIGRNVHQVVASS